MYYLIKHGEMYLKDYGAYWNSWTQQLPDAKRVWTRDQATDLALKLGGVVEFHTDVTESECGAV